MRRPATAGGGCWPVSLAFEPAVERIRGGRRGGSRPHSACGTRRCTSRSMPLAGRGRRAARPATPLDLRQPMMQPPRACSATQALLVGLTRSDLEIADERRRGPRARSRSASVQVLLLEGDGGVQHDDDDFGEADGAQPVGDGELFQLLLDPGSLAHAGGVEQLEFRPSAPFPFDGDGVAGDAGLGPGQQALLADRSALISVDLPALGRPMMAIAQRLGHVRPEPPRHQGSAMSSPTRARRPEGLSGSSSSGGKTRPRRSAPAPRSRSAMPSPCSAEKRHRLAEAERKGVQHAALGALVRLGLVGDEDDRLAGAADESAKGAVTSASARPWHRS
jgi:hypothetical protein